MKLTAWSAAKFITAVVTELDAIHTRHLADGLVDDSEEMRRLAAQATSRYFEVIVSAWIKAGKGRKV